MQPGVVADQDHGADVVRNGSEAIEEPVKTLSPQRLNASAGTSPDSIDTSAHTARSATTGATEAHDTVLGNRLVEKHALSE